MTLVAWSVFLRLVFFFFFEMIFWRFCGVRSGLFDDLIPPDKSSVLVCATGFFFFFFFFFVFPFCALFFIDPSCGLCIGPGFLFFFFVVFFFSDVFICFFLLPFVPFRRILSAPPVPWHYLFGETTV